MPFAHLHNHSHYSLLDGLPKIEDMVQRAKELGLSALALTDHGVMYGAIEFYKEAKAAGIKPIIGMEGYLAPGSRHEKKGGEKPFHQILYARDLQGYKNLMKLSSRAHLEGFYYKPRFDKALLEEYAEGLIGTSSCLQGEIPQMILAGTISKAIEMVREYQRIFGPENFYLEVQPHPEIPEQVRVNKVVLEIAKEYKIPTIATNDSHYLKKTDAEAQDILMCVQTGKTVQDSDRLNMTSVDLSMKTEEEMRSAFPENPEVIEETGKLAERCEVKLELGKFHFPVFELPQGVTADDYLAQLAHKGLAEKCGEPAPAGYRERVEYELSVIKTKQYATYFLIFADFANWARSRGIIATVRGSAAGSLVSYVSGITTVDPMTYHLPFERFLNPYRPSAPDIDMDFADNRRGEVLHYVREKYGEDKVAQICTFGTMMARGAVRDVGRALGYPYSFCDRISKMIPQGRQGFAMTIRRAINESTDLAAVYQNEPEARRLLGVAEHLEGCARHPSVHAAGVVIAPTELSDFTPLQKETGGENVITQYDMHAVEDAGLVKMDFLGIRNLSILGNAVKLAKITKGVDIKLDTLPMDDAKTFALLAEGRTMGMFQLGGSGMTRYLVELKPSKITDIMAMVALFRPGPMESIPAFIERKHNPKKITHLDARLAPILKDSYGIITYQDDVLYIAIEIAGYNWEEADKLRKAMGKKIPEEMAAQKDKFVNGCINHGGVAPEKAEKLWGLIEPFAAYGFNKAHAASYGIVAYQTAYLKAHYPAEFMAALMSAESDAIEKVAEAVEECKEMSITVLPPDVNESFADFTVIDDATIRFGLSAIKNIGNHIVEVIIAERKKNGPFSDISNFLKRVADRDLNRKSLESFIKSGALDSLGSRHTLFAGLDMLLAYAKNEHEAAERNQSSLFSEAGSTTAHELRLTEAAEDAATTLAWEKELLGLYVSGHPLDSYRKLLATSPHSIATLTSANAGVELFALVKETKEITTKRGELMAFITLEDLTGTAEAIAFPKLYSARRPLFAQSQLLRISGKTEERNGAMQIIIEAAELLDEKSARRIDGSRELGLLEVRLGIGTSSETIARLREILYNAQGTTPVIIRINGSRKIRLPVKVDATNGLTEKLKALVGEQHVYELSQNNPKAD
ncbi:MAG: DNA polymerase III subunit alpha [Parcubacteria group bacterium]|nr:DNA polymerase III subunit alpha [Parcubacteria group bacterium]